MRQKLIGQDEDTFAYDHDKTTHESARTGKEIFIQDAQGRTEAIRNVLTSERFSYTDRNLRARHEDGADVTRSWEYTGQGDLSALGLASGAKAVIEREGRKISAITIAGKRLLSISYANGFPSAMSDAQGNVFKIVWNKDRKGFAIIDPDGYRTSVGLNASHELVSIETSDAEETRIKRDAVGNPVRVQSPSYATSYTWDSEGRLASEQQDEKGTRFYTYDEHGNLTRIDEGERWVKVARDDAGRIVRTDLDDGQWFSASYDEAGHMRSAEDSHGNAMECEYDQGGRLSRMSDAAGSWLAFDRDGAGRPVHISDNRGASQSIAYGFDGEVKAFTDNRTGTYSFTRDALGRVIAVCDDEGPLIEARRNTAGDIVSAVNAAGEKAVFDRDWSGRIVDVRADGTDTSIAYDRSKRAEHVRVTKGKNGAPVFEERRSYTSGGRLSSIEGPLGLESFKWTRDGKLRSRTDALGVTVTSISDDGRNVRVERPDGTVREATLSRDLRFATVSDSGKKMSMSFNEQGRPTHADMGDGVCVDYTFDRAGRLLEVSHSKAPTVSYAYDESGRISGIKQGDMGVTYAYDAAGRIVLRKFADGTSVSYGYDHQGNLSSLVARDADGTSALSQRYSYDRLGRMVSRTVERSGETDELSYSYDVAGRLTGVLKNGEKYEDWEYDSMGNVLRETDPHGTTVYDYDESGRMVSSDGPEGVKRYEWDARSRLSRVTDSKGTPVLDLLWNAADRLVSSKSRRGTTTYVYDALGNRVSQCGPDGSFSWAIDPLRTERNVLGWGSGNDLKSALSDGAVPLWSGGTSLVSDANGTPLATTRNLSAELLGSPFGDGAWGGLAFGYAGYSPDPATGMLHSRFREYDPTTRRFCSPDPNRGSVVSPRTLNRWVCCFDDPVNLVDVDGGFPSWSDIGNGLKSAGEAIGNGINDAGNAVAKWWNDNADLEVSQTIYKGNGHTTTESSSVGDDRWIYTNVSDGKVTGGGFRIPGVVSIGWDDGLTVSVGGGDYNGFTIGANLKIGASDYGPAVSLDANVGSTSNNVGFGAFVGATETGFSLFSNTKVGEVTLHDQQDYHIPTAVVAVIALAFVVAPYAIPAIAEGYSMMLAGAGGTVAALAMIFGSATPAFAAEC